MLNEMKECHAWYVAHWSQAHHVLHACTIDKIILLMCWRVHTKYVDDTIVRPELWPALERYTTVYYLHNLSLHSVLQINTTVDTEFTLCKGDVHVGPSFVKFPLLQQTLQLLSCGWIHCSICYNTGRSLTCDMPGSWSCKLDTGCLNFTNLMTISNTNQKDFQLPNDNKMTMPRK